MRTKNFLVLLFFVFGISLMLILFGSQRSESLQNIVTTTHQHIRNFQDTLRDAEEKILVADEKYLRLLGFVDRPRTYPNDTWHNTSLPVIVTYAFDGDESQAIGLVNSVGRALPNNTILVYGLGLGGHSLQTLQSYCNSSRCQVVTYPLEEFPSHVWERAAHAFRPLVVQDALQRTGSVLYLDNDQRATRQLTAAALAGLVRAARPSGALAWPMRMAVSSLTHKKMFEYFRTRADSFLFVQMVDARRLLLLNTAAVRRGVMLPWAQCALTPDCLRPIGAQSAGCRFDKKPQYRYSGCHSYDVSALNIALGLHFRLDSTRYTYEGAHQLFSRADPETAAAELAELERNATADARTTAATADAH